jgi:hypothetical protein
VLLVDDSNVHVLAVSRGPIDDPATRRGVGEDSFTDWDEKADLRREVLHTFGVLKSKHTGAKPTDRRSALWNSIPRCPQP